MAKALDSTVDEFRNRPLDRGPYSYVWVDALTQRCREGGRVVNVRTVIATGVNADGYREILGVDVFTSEDGAAWTSFLRGLVARGLSDVRLVISDDHLGLKRAIAAVLPGAGWQRCRVHFIRNLLTRVPKSAQTLVATLVRSIFAQPDQEAVWAQHGRIVEQLLERFPEAAQLLAEAGPDVLAFTTFPREHWRQIWSNNPQERLNKEVRRRTDVVGIFPMASDSVATAPGVSMPAEKAWRVGSQMLMWAYTGPEPYGERLRPLTSIFHEGGRSAQRESPTQAERMIGSSELRQAISDRGGDASAADFQGARSTAEDGW